MFAIHFRLDNCQKSKDQKQVRLNYRAAQVVHNWAMEVFQPFLLLASVAGAEMVTICALFAAIRLNTHGSTNEKFMALAFLSTRLFICFYIFKQCIEVASKVTDAFRNFSRIPFLIQGSRFRFAYENKVFLASCKPLVLTVGEICTITKQSFPTISQDIILGSIVNLLLTFGVSELELDN